jgi:hypothetical protein
MTKRVVAIVGLAVTTWAGVPATAMAGGARLYEMTENMRLTQLGAFKHRQATSYLLGTADVGTPLCPAALVAALSPGASSCTVNAVGTDDIDLGSGLGNFIGTFTVVVQGDNNADSPELVVMKGGFSGKMDFSPAILRSIPLGHVTGRMVINGTRGAFPFSGTFRLPFVVQGVKPDYSGFCTPGGAVACWPLNDAAYFTMWQGAVPPLPLNPMDHYDLTVMTRPLYLMDDGRTMVPVTANEFGGGWAAVRFEISF